ncbi:MAG: hypothetical protein ACE5FR_13625 [Rhodospirillales bacterium]
MRPRHGLGATLAACGVLVSFLAHGPAVHAQSREAVAFGNAIVAKIQKYAANPSTAKLGELTGLWRGGGGVESIYHVGDVFIESAVNTETGDLTPIGFAENRQGTWSGWFRTSCRNCCPGVFYWGKGALAASARKGVIRVRIAGRRIDPARCVRTDAPQQIDDTLKLVESMSFKEILPGKYIHIVAAPQVGSQAAQYKASVTVRWNLTGTGVATVSMGVRGPGYGKPLFQKQARVKGEHEFLADRSGKYTFRLAAFNRAGRPLHIELLSVKIPAIPGIGR